MKDIFMFSLIFFIFVAFIVLGGVILAMLRHKKLKSREQPDQTTAISNTDEEISSRTALRNSIQEERDNRLAGRMIPTDSRRPQSDNEESGDRP